VSQLGWVLKKIFLTSFDSRNPSNASDQFLYAMNWPTYNASSEFYLDIGMHLVEKQGMFLQRYGVWDNTIAEFGN
jgi:hypothetical protein